MKLELLPNEILLDLFDYFDGTDLLRVFFGLNIRFNSLLYQKMQSYYFQFKSISKRDFDWICQQHLPFIANKVFALELSNEKDTPEQLNLFLVYVPSFKPFIHIQSLTINHVSSYQILLKLLDECQHLCNLTRLKLLYWSFQDFPFDSKLISNKIWSLPKLTNCHLGPGTTDIYHFSLPNIVSTSIETLVLSFDRFQWNEIYQLIEYTPRLTVFRWVWIRGQCQMIKYLHFRH